MTQVGTEPSEHVLPRTPPSRHRWRLPLAVGGLSAAVGLWQPGPLVAVNDELAWTLRSERFAESFMSGDWSQMSPAGSSSGATMPGVTTMWLGSAARAIAGVAHELGLIDSPARPFGGSAAGLRVAHLLMAIVTATMIAAIVVLTRRLLGPAAAAITGVLLAVEPFVVSNGIVLHTDSLVALPVVLSFLALAIALGSSDQDTGASDRPWWTAASGALAGVALLTKLNAVVALLALAPVVAHWVRRLSRYDGAHRRRRVLLVTAIWLASVVLTVLVLWPAIWLEPGVQLDAIGDSAALGIDGHLSYFLGEPTSGPGPAFYPVVLLVRLSPWLLAAACVGAVAGLRDRLVRPLLAVILIAPLPYLALMTLAHKKFDRYALVFVPFLVLAAGAGLGRLWEQHRPGWSRRVRRSAGAALACVLALPVISVSPHSHAWTNPLVGGPVSERLILRGRGEGLELLGREVARAEGSDCSQTRIAVYLGSSLQFPCGEVVRLHDGVVGQVDYIVLYINDRQRDLHEGAARWARRHGELISTARLDGVDYAWLYRVPRDGRS